MNIPPLSRSVQASQLPLELLAHNKQLSEKQKVAELSRQFEAVLVRQILREAQKTIIPSSWNEDSYARDVYQDLITVELARAISASGSLGLGRALEQELTQQVLSGESHEGEAKPESND